MTSTKSSDMALNIFVNIEQTHSKSVNVEYSETEKVNERYVPTGKALETLNRILDSLIFPESCRSFAITGPYGSGKSSFAVFLGHLLQKNNKGHKKAVSVLRNKDSETLLRLETALKKSGESDCGFLVGMATAQREPVAESLRRAIENSLDSDLAFSGKSALKKLISRDDVSANEIIGVAKKITDFVSLVIVLDEFGKNLESFKEKPAESDLFILQQLAELAQSSNKHQLVVLTLKHLAFNEYANDLDQGPRRELAKVQGRFEEVMFIENPAETRRLISELFTTTNAEFGKATSQWLKKTAHSLAAAGLDGILESDSLSKSLPLHPMNLACLPELCSRFAQNDRTLFAYLGSNDPRSVHSFIENETWASKRQLPLVRIDHLYDYFVESVSTSISTSDLSSRWIEIETRIRDTAGLSLVEVQVLKTVGVLNLISAGGVYRASRDAVSYSLNDCTFIEDAASASREAIERLVSVGILVYREFADEYRIWFGTDYPLQDRLQLERGSARGKTLEALLNETSVLSPIVASRHSQTKGIMRIFERSFGTIKSIGEVGLVEGLTTDGHLLLSVEPGTIPEFVNMPTKRPVVVSVPSSIDEIKDTAIEAFALMKVTAHAESVKADRIAMREIAERISLVSSKLMTLIQKSWLSGDAELYWVTSKSVVHKSGNSLSKVLSDVCDEVYKNCPEIRNEMISRREVTGQGARARRLLSEAMIAHTTENHFSIDGYGPERAMYEAVFRKSGIHVLTGDGAYGLELPSSRSSSWAVVAKQLKELFDQSIKERLPLEQVCLVLQSPPFGLKMGLIPLLLLIEIVRRGDDLLVYEHGSLVTNVDDAIAERLIKNPNHFSVKVLNQSSESLALLGLYSENLFHGREITEPSIVAIGKKVYNEVRSLSRYSLSTKEGILDSASKVRSSIKEATELDVLLLETLPKAVGREPLTLGAISKTATLTIQEVSKAFNDLVFSYENMLKRVHKIIAEEFGLSKKDDVSNIQKRTEVQAKIIQEGAFEPNLKALSSALLRRDITDKDWIEHVALVVAGGKVPHGWDDDQFNLFQLSARNFIGLFNRLTKLTDLSKSSGLSSNEAVLVSVTSESGSEIQERFYLTQSEVAVRNQLVADAVNQLEETGLSSNDAFAALISELIEQWKISKA